jgi:glyoxylase-like metal-dependent hydrolase (beta-lactamase superfamily II)
MSKANGKLYQSRKITDNLFVYLWQGRGNNCNCILFADVLTGGHPHVLIDPGHIINGLGENCFAELVRSIEDDGYSIEDIGLIINTHTHPDHCEANSLIVEKSGADITLSKEEHIFRQKNKERLSAVIGDGPEFTPLFFLQSGTLCFGRPLKVALEVFIMPGHSPGSVCLYWKEKNILISGDVLFYGSIGRTDLPGGNHMEMKKSIQKLSELEVDILVPGHSTQYGAIIEGRQQNERNFQVAKLYC